jgi:phage terminase large subunit-like protein
MTRLTASERRRASHRALWEADHPEEVTAVRERLGEANWAHMASRWTSAARKAQTPPEGDWRVWLIMAGRGFGKTRAAAEWIDAEARARPRSRIALVGATIDDVRQVMIEGESGLLSCARTRPAPIWNPSLRRLIWPGGAMAICYSAAEAETLRGPAHHLAWADEVARWDAGGGARGDGPAARTRGQRAWDNLLLGLRLGPAPRVVATTTPRNVPVLHSILAMDGLALSRGASADNADNLSGSFIEAMQAIYGETALGRQELGGELIADVPGALWTRGMIERCRMASRLDGARRSPSCGSGPARNLRYPLAEGERDGVGEELALARVVIGVDPPASSTGDACGIVVAGMLSCPEPEGFEFVVLADASVERASPERWARAVAEAAMRWGADRIVAEANQGGEMVRRVLEAERRHLPVELRFASAGKAARAEPVALAYARGRVAHAGVFAALEDQLCGMQAGGGYAGPGRSPDRADACVWALAELMRAAEQTGPRVRMV